MTFWHQEARDMRRLGYGVEDIAVKLGAAASAVYKLFEADAKAAPKPSKTTDTEKRVLEAYYMRPDLSVIGIAKRVKLEAGMVRAILERAGLPEAKGVDE